MGSKRDRNTQANLRRGREELVIARQKVAAAEQKIADARNAAEKRIAAAQLEVGRANARMKDHMGRLKDILNRLYLMQLLSTSQHHDAVRWLDNEAINVNSIDPHEESLFTMFTQQHYTALAQVIRETRQNRPHSAARTDSQEWSAGVETGISELQMRLMKMLAKDNPKFKELLFIAAASEHDDDDKKTRR